MSLETRVIALARRLEDRLHNIASPIELARYGEPAVAAEILLDNLYEFDVRLTADELDICKQLAADLRLAPSYVDILYALPRPGDRRRR